MPLLLLAEAVSNQAPSLAVMAGGVLVGVATHLLADWLRGGAAAREKLEAKAEEVIATKFDNLAEGLRTQIDGQGQRLDDLEGRIDELGAARHEHEMRIANELNAIRVAIAEKAASKQDVHALGQEVRDLTLKVTQLLATSRLTDNRRDD